MVGRSGIQKPKLWNNKVKTVFLYRNKSDTFYSKEIGGVKAPLILFYIL